MTVPDLPPKPPAPQWMPTPAPGRPRRWLPLAIVTAAILLEAAIVTAAIILGGEIRTDNGTHSSTAFRRQLPVSRQPSLAPPATLGEQPSRLSTLFPHYPMGGTGTHPTSTLTQRIAMRRLLARWTYSRQRSLQNRPTRRLQHMSTCRQSTPKCRNCPTMLTPPSMGFQVILRWPR